jgi:peptide/nickel transport system substrate-binding protein
VDVTAADTLASKPVGTGPFAVTSWDPQQSIVLEANPAYWGAVPASQRIELKLLPDAASQVSSLRAGDVDVIWAEQPSELDPFVDSDDFQILEFEMNGVQLMAMNCANEALADVRVRQAVNLAVNKDELIDTVWWGYGTKIGSHFPPVAQGFVDLADTYGYDPDAARELLEEAGYGDGLTLRMRLPESYPNYVSAGQVIADSLGKVGITCAIEIVDWTTWLSEVYNGRDYDLTVVGHTGRVDPIVLLARYGSASSENYFNYANDEVDELIVAYRSELDEDVRTGYVEQIQRILAQDVPALYIQTPVMTYVAAAGVHDFGLHPLDLLELEDAWVEA